jgi:hypothetical protein
MSSTCFQPGVHLQEDGCICNGIACFTCNSTSSPVGAYTDASTPYTIPGRTTVFLKTKPRVRNWLQDIKQLKSVVLSVYITQP